MRIASSSPLATCLVLGLALALAGCLEVSRPALVTPGGQPDAGVTADTAGGVDAGGVDAGAPDTWSPVCGQCGDGNPCTEDLCDEATGQCVHDPVANGVSCGGCGAACVDGVCMMAGEVPGCASDADCDDNDPCTTDTCHDDCTCSQTPIPGCGMGCDAPGACTSDLDCPQPGAMCAYAWCNTDTCTCHIAQEPGCGGCAGGCEDGNPCTLDTCDAATGLCLHDPAGMDGKPCGACGASCWDGMCVGPAVEPQCGADAHCDDGDPCTQDFCVDACYCEHVTLPSCGVCDSCFDGNECTLDVCTSAGDCSFPPVAEGTPCGGCGVCSNGQCLQMGGGCASDADCDDGDPCTVNTCDGCVCMASVSPNCGTPCATNTDCEDGDACTVNTCAGGVCQSAFDPGCQPDPVCSSQGVRPISDFLWGPPGQTVKVAGVPQGANMYTCTAAVCDPNDPCCNTCMGDLQIVDIGWGLVSGPVDDLEPGWTCSADSCGATLACQPPHVGTGYWVWGTTYEWFGGGLPFVVAAPSVALGVDGWCVQTTPAGLPGVWVGPVTLVDAMTGTATSYEVRLTIAYDAATDQWVMSLEPTAACSSCSPHIPPQQATGVVVGDGDLSFTLQVTTGAGPTPVGVYLTSWHNTLSGDVGTFQVAGGGGSGVPFVPMPAGPTGTLSVTKQAPGAAVGGGTGGGTPGSGAP